MSDKPGARTLKLALQKSPTIVELANPDWVAVHAAVQAERFWDIIERLRELGALEILVTPIESMSMWPALTRTRTGPYTPRKAISGSRSFGLDRTTSRRFA